MLTGLKITLEMLGTEPGQDNELVREAVQTVDDLLRRVRELWLDLRPPLLDDLGLQPALAWLAERFRVQAGLEVGLVVRGLQERLSSDLEISIFRIVQEALTNVVRHAGTDRAEVYLEMSGEKVSLRIQDAGRGFHPDAQGGPGAGAGLIGV